MDCASFSGLGLCRALQCSLSYVDTVTCSPLVSPETLGSRGRTSRAACTWDGGHRERCGGRAGRAAALAPGAAWPGPRAEGSCPSASSPSELWLLICTAAPVTHPVSPHQHLCCVRIRLRRCPHLVCVSKAGAPRAPQGAHRVLSAWRLGQCSEHVSWPLLPWEQALMNMYLGGTLTCPGCCS